MESVDEFLEPLLEDYTTLYKENALLKSKMKVLVSKLEEYRSNEASMKDAIVNAQKTCDLMVKEAETKCAQMLNDANAAATENAKNADALIAAEQARVEDARKTACDKIDELKEQILSCVKALDRIKAANPPAPSAETGVFDFPDRIYGNVPVPAGRYRALRITIGGGEGHNWWCVLYPKLCALDEIDYAGGEPVYYSKILRWIGDKIGGLK